MSRLKDYFSSKNYHDSSLNGSDEQPTEPPIRDMFIDSPKVKYASSRTLRIEGWLVPSDPTSTVVIRATINDKTYEVPYGKRRQDVAEMLSSKGFIANAECGFFREIDNFQDGSLVIEADIGDGYSEIYRTEVAYSPEDLVEMMVNPNSPQYLAEHMNLVENRKSYYFESNHNGEYSRAADDPRLIAFYLPQFHPIPENDSVWGKGFTEWSNVTKGTPRFVGHQQPILPEGLGFYDLRVADTIKDQISLAKQHGIYGFCFYYYWFSGRRVLEKPLNTFLGQREWDFNFTICWANENWTKRWDGRDNEVIIAQEYKKDDPLNFIKDVEHILNDSRYICEDGKPVLIVYRASELKEPKVYADTWRKYFRDHYGKELFLVSAMGFDVSDPRSYGFDAGLDFVPQTAFFKQDLFEGATFPYVTSSVKLLDRNFNGDVADYRAIATNKKITKYFDFPTIKSVAPSWDNDARKKGGGFVLQGANPDLYGEWLTNVIREEAATKKAPMIFINAWNEWAEGAILEPSAHQGYANLNRTTEVLALSSSEAKNRANFPLYGFKKSKNKDIAVILHINNDVIWGMVAARLRALEPLGYDLYVTATLKYAPYLEEVRQFKPDANVRTVPNRGRDMLPFVFTINRISKLGYQTVLKLTEDENNSRQDTGSHLDAVLPSGPEVIDKIMKTMETAEPTFIFSGGQEEHGRALNTKKTNQLLGAYLSIVLTEDLGMNEFSELRSSYRGRTFWANARAIEGLATLQLGVDDFEPELDQREGTFAHELAHFMSFLSVIDCINCFTVQESAVVRCGADSVEE